MTNKRDKENRSLTSSVFRERLLCHAPPLRRDNNLKRFTLMQAATILLKWEKNGNEKVINLNQTANPTGLLFANPRYALTKV